MSTPANSADRAAMLLLARRARAYFAPVNRTTATPAIFDPAGAAAFNVDAPPAPWLSLGWIENLKRGPATPVEPLRAGPRGATVAQFRGPLQAHVEFDFAGWGKLQMALAGGGEHRNVLAGAAVALLTTSTASVLALGAAASFAAGDLVAVDVDYAGQTGYLGSGIAAGYVRSASQITGGADYVRRVTFNVARVAAVASGSLQLAQSLPGGAPAAGARVQKVVGFVDREGGSFFQEWSALFVIDSDAGGRLFLNYPRLQAAASAQESRSEVLSPLEMLALHASFTALPSPDAYDGEQVVCYRAWLPAPTAAAY